MESPEVMEYLLNNSLHMSQDPDIGRWQSKTPENHWADIVIDLFALPSDDPLLLFPLPSEEEWSIDSDEDHQEVPPRPYAESSNAEQNHRYLIEA